MKQKSTLFLKIIIYFIKLAILTLCIIISKITISKNTKMFLPMILVILTTAIPFFFKLYQNLKLLNTINKNTTFSNLSIKTIKNIKNYTFTINILYTTEMPFIIYATNKNNTPNTVIIKLIFIFTPLITNVFTAILKKLLQNAITIKSKNDLTI